ncbi:MAG TPA: phosphotransferase [Nocardioidaceae bacterium]
MTAADGAGQAVWETDEFRDRALTWIDAALAEHDLRRTGEVEERVRNWAAVYRVPTDGGVFWFKAEGRGQAFEAPLYPLLQRLVPDRVLHPLAVDVQRAWLLLPDGGTILRQTLGDGAEAADAMAGFLPEYARLQIELMPHVPELLAVGVVDMSPAVMLRRFDEALVVAKRYVDVVVARGGETTSPHPSPRSAAEVQAAYDRIVERRDRVERQCRLLSNGAVPPSLQHDDLHDGNVFATAPDAPPRFFDWGDAVVAHPFATLLITLRVLCDEAGVLSDDPVVHQVRDAYLEPFGLYASHAELVELLEAACDVGKVTRSLTWARELRAMPADQAAEFAANQFYWLEELTVDDYLGSPPDAD